MNILREIRYNKTLKFWICSYLTIVLVSLGINLAGYSAVIHITNAEKQRNASDLTAQMRFIYDNYFRQMEISAHNLLESYAVKNLISMPESTKSKDEWIKTIIRDVMLQESGMAVLKNVILIFNYEDICIVNNGMYTKDIAYEILFKPYYSTKEAWLSDTFSVLNKEYKIIGNSDGEQKNYFMYAYSTLNRESPLVLMAEINGEVLKESLKQSELIGENRVVVVDKTGQEIFSENNSKGVTIPLNSERGFTNIKYNNTKYSAWYVSSEVVPYKYVYMVRDTDYAKQLRAINTMFIISCFLCLLIGVLLSLLFARKNYMPIRTLAKKLKSNTDDMEIEVIETIEHEIESLLNDKRQSDKMIAIQQNTAKEEFLSRLAKGRFYDDKGIIYDEFKKHHMNISAVESYVILFSIQETGAFSQNGNTDDEDEKLVRFAVSNVCPELMGDNFQLHFFLIDDYYACLALALSEQQEISYVKKKLNKLLAFFKSNFGVLLTASLSQVSDDFRMIPKLYSQASEAMSYRLLIDEGNLLDYDQLINNTQAYSYNIQDSNKLINLLSAGNDEEAIEFVRDIVRHNKREKNINIHMMRMLLVEIAGTLLKATIEADKNNSVNTIEFIGKLMQLMDYSKLEEVLAQFDAYIRELCGVIRQNQHQTKAVRCNNIKLYVEENCMNPNLAVSMIASEFGLSLSYLSNYFKEQTGIGVAEYIAKCRINQAKQLLDNTTLSIGEIGEKTGFFSTAVFIRTFKKLELTTPGQYRKMHGVSDAGH